LILPCILNSGLNPIDIFGLRASFKTRVDTLRVGWSGLFVPIVKTVVTPTEMVAPPRGSNVVHVAGVDVVNVATPF
jgi:hypothetical protein